MAGKRGRFGRMQENDVIRGGVDAIDETFLAGWLAAPEGTGPIGFDVYVDDRLIWFDREANERRPDLAIDGLEPFGFLVTLPDDLAPGPACVRLTARGTRRTLLETRLEKGAGARRAPIRGAFEQVSVWAVAGWLAAPAGAGSVRFDVYVDDRLILVDQEATEARQGAGAAARGFAVTLPEDACRPGASLRITSSGAKRVLLETRLADAAGPAEATQASAPA